MNEETIDKIFYGNLTNLPPVSSKIVRIFTSSTFTDMLMERNTLMEYVYPKIKEYCREKHGLEFQVVDMRWGVRDEMTNEHMTTELCMTELRNCQRLSMGPNFIYFGAQKYGYRPIPTEIITSELMELRETLVTMGNDVTLLDKWYRADTNAVPAVSILQPITTHLVHFLNKRVPQLQARDSGIWWGTLPKMQLMLRKAAHTLFVNGKMTHEEMHDYYMAVTEREVINGCLSIQKGLKDHVIIYTRIINNINLQNLKRASAFIDIQDRKVDQEAIKLLAHYRDELLPKKMSDNNAIYKKYVVEWIGREGLAPETHEDYLNEFINHFYKNVLRLVDRAMKKEDTSAQGKIVTEILQHLHACIKSVDVFYGRTDELAQLRKYIIGDNNEPFILFGSGGSGKTALLSKAACKSMEATDKGVTGIVNQSKRKGKWKKLTSDAQKQNEWEVPGKPILIVRYLGTTPDSSSLLPLLTSICQQLSYTFLLPFDDIPDDVVPLTAYLKELLNLGSESQPLLIFLDSVDQIVGTTDGNRMSWLPLNLPPHCKIVVSCTREEEKPHLCKDYDVLTKMVHTPDNFLEVTELGSELAFSVMKSWMRSAGRDLNNYQWRVVANAVEACSLPIFCKLVFAEICRWKSYSRPQDCYLAHDVMDSIFLLFEKVETKHGWLLVSHALAYVTASKSGLSETELEDLISLDDKVLDDIYQYHLPPTRRVPPLLWTRVRSDLPGYLSDSEADGVNVINWYHRQFIDAAKERYFKTKDDFLYYHKMMSEFFLGMWGGGTPKPFKFTEIQKHRFGLKSKDSEADRQVPAMPLVFYTKDGDISRYNLRKFGELPYHLVRCGNFSDLFAHVLFNYQWLYAKLCACPLQTVLADFEDAKSNLDNKDVKREIMLIADSLRLGGAILGKYPSMLAPQLVGRLLSEAQPEQEHNDNVCKLLIQCDVEGPNHNALVPTYHCLHTPGGPLKYSLEGHQFAIFGFKITSDYRYIVSVSNKFITWDISTSDLSREVHPKVDGLMMDLQISNDSRFVAAYTNNNQTILLNTLVSEYIVIDNPFDLEEDIQGLCLLDDHLIIYSQNAWTLYTTSGVQKKMENLGLFTIMNMVFRSLNDYSLICWSGDVSDPKMTLSTTKRGTESTSIVNFHSAFVLNSEQTKFWACGNPLSYDISLFEFVGGSWKKIKDFAENQQLLLQISLSTDQKYLIGTYHGGFHIWSNHEKSGAYDDSPKHLNLKLPNAVRNVLLKMNKSNACVLSASNQYAISGIRKEMYIWCMKTGELVKTLEAHIARIVDIQPLVVGNWNCVITSSMDRTVKVWNINYIFEPVHHIDRHESPIESVSLSTKAGIAITVTRGCIGVWNLLTGKLTSKLADSALGAIVTFAKVTTSGAYIIAAESGYLLYWDVAKKEVIYKEEQKDIIQVMLFENDTKCLVVSKSTKELQEQLKANNALQSSGNGNIKEGEVEENSQEKKKGQKNLATKSSEQYSAEDSHSKSVIGIVRQIPQGVTEYLFEVPGKMFKPIVITADQQYFVSYANEKSKDMLFVHHVSTGTFLHKFQLKYPKFKDVSELVPLPDKASQVAVIDQEKGNVIDIRNKKFVKSFPNWGGCCSKNGKYGIYAPSKGGLDLLDLHHNGNVAKTLIPKTAEGIHTVICKFNETNEYVLYYHGGRKTLRVFRVSDGVMIANYRVSSHLSSVESTTDGKSVALGMVDGSVTVLTIADPKKPNMSDYLKNLPSRRGLLNVITNSRTTNKKVEIK